MCLWRQDVIVGERRFQYEAEVKKNPLNYDSWFDYIRLEEAAGDYDKVREVWQLPHLNWLFADSASGVGCCLSISFCSRPCTSTLTTLCQHGWNAAFVCPAVLHMTTVYPNSTAKPSCNFVQGADLQCPYIRVVVMSCCRCMREPLPTSLQPRKSATGSDTSTFGSTMPCLRSWRLKTWSGPERSTELASSSSPTKSSPLPRCLSDSAPHDCLKCVFDTYTS